MQYPFLWRNADNTFERAGKTVRNLCASWNGATNPALPMTDAEHHRARQYAKAIMNRMRRMGFRYRELSNGAIWPIEW